MPTPQNWLARYQGGQRQQVWLELRQLGRAVRAPEHIDEVTLVCDEMARRARQNVEVLVERLSSAGFRFHTNDDEQSPVTPHFPPSPTAASHADWLEERFGDVPLTLLSWVRIVGDVWLVGTHPDWSESAAADPLVVEVEGSSHPEHSIKDYFENEHDGWRDWTAQGHDLGPFVLPVAPDHYHKDNVSGGSPYGFVLPDGCADGLFVAETAMPFVSYLNWVFGNGGFPRPTDSRDQYRVKSALAEDLLPL